MFAVPKEVSVRIHASSGTTGKQTVVGYTKNDIDVWSRSVARALTSIGTTKSDYVHVSYGYGLFPGGFRGCAMERSIWVRPQFLFLQEIQNAKYKFYRITVLIFYAVHLSYAMYIGETARDMGIDTKQLPVRAGFFGAEPWTEHMRQELEAILNIKAYDIYYGCLSEIAGPGVAFECPAQQGMHYLTKIFSILKLLILIRKKFFLTENLESWHLPASGKEALPLIRYRTRDICKLERGLCSCGRTFGKDVQTKRQNRRYVNYSWYQCISISN